MSGFVEEIVRVTTTGTAGSATGTADSNPISGTLFAIKVDYHASAPGTTLVDVDELGGMARKLTDLAAGNTDLYFYPLLQGADNTGSAVAGAYTNVVIPGRRVRVTVTASNALTDAVVVTFIYREER